MTTTLFHVGFSLVKNVLCNQATTLIKQKFIRCESKKLLYFEAYHVRKLQLLIVVMDELLEKTRDISKRKIY